MGPRAFAKPWRIVSSVLPVVAALELACAPASLPPVPQIMVVADTDLPVPLVSRLRVDLYREDGTWFESRDYARPDPRDWPASFSVYADDDGRDHLIWVRLRVYRDGGEITYRGERFRRWDTPFSSRETSLEPRLLQEGRDVTPLLVPAPLETVDRLLAVRIGPKSAGSVYVLLQGTCIGTMARLGPDGRPRLGESESCVDTEKTWAKVAPSPLAPRGAAAVAPRVGTWLTSTCPKDDGSSSRVCIPGGATLLGSEGETGEAFQADGSASLPIVRLFGVHGYALDRYEVSVRRFRDAIARGYNGPRPSQDQPRCNFKDAAGSVDELPVNCITWDAARAFCQFEGGDLPTEVQWEHAASVAGFREKSAFPWGPESPECKDAVYERDDGDLRVTRQCAALGVGPQPVGAAARDATPLGVRDLFGSMQEWTRDYFERYRTTRWAAMPLVDPECKDDDENNRSVRGVSWNTTANITSERFFVGPSASGIGLGFRCAYEAPR